jgi:hypothetical protein
MMLTISISPASPWRSRFSNAAKFGSKRRLKPIIRGLPVFSTVARQRRIRSESRSTGFSQNTALPAVTAASIRSACVSVGVQIRMASMPASPMIACASATFAPAACASEDAASVEASATATSRASPRAATLSP